MTNFVAFLKSQQFLQICQQAFAVNKQDIIRKVWDDHLFSVAHDQRTSSLEKNKFG